MKNSIEVIYLLKDSSKINYRNIRFLSKLVFVEKIRIFINKNKKINHRKIENLINNNKKISIYKENFNSIDLLINFCILSSTVNYMLIIGDDLVKVNKFSLIKKSIYENRPPLTVINSINNLKFTSFSIIGNSVESPINVLKELETDLGFISILVFKTKIINRINIPIRVIGTNWIILYISLYLLTQLQSIYVIRNPIIFTPIRNLHKNTWYNYLETHTLGIAKIYNYFSNSFMKNFKHIFAKKINNSLKYHLICRFNNIYSGYGLKYNFSIYEIIELIKLSPRSILYFLVIKFFSIFNDK